jgi:hypothetical protein
MSVSVDIMPQSIVMSILLVAMAESVCGGPNPTMSGGDGGDVAMSTTDTMLCGMMSTLTLMHPAASTTLSALPTPTTTLPFCASTVTSSCVPAV